MNNKVSNRLLAQLFSSYSDDPFLMLVTLNHETFPNPIYLCNNIKPVVSRGKTFEAFPMSIVLPVDDGETAREVSIQFDNVSRRLVDELRGIITPIDIKIEMVLASHPNQVEVELIDLKLRNITYNKSTITAKLYMDAFLDVELTSEKYTPQNFPGLF